MKRRKIVYLFLLGTILCTKVEAQQQVMFTQYMFNGMALNPAYAGTHNAISATLLAREQWVGLDGAPSTQTFTVHSPINETKKVSLGAMVLRDEIGITEQTSFTLAFAYRLQLGVNTQLSFGLQGNYNNFNSRYSDLNINDPVFTNADVTVSKFNFGAGAYLYTDQFFLGVSSPQLIRNEFDKNNADSDSFLERHYFAYTGYVFPISENVKAKPNVLMKYVEGAPVEFDINANFLFYEKLWLGLSYRSFDSFDAIAQFQITKQLQIGYAYDFATTTDLRRVNSGSHEFMLQFNFNFSRDRIISPRYF
ncbi:type IX secretion system membrane protein PorP/SprF [Leptobacterium sp. I13]|uniref:PorP/SprF family type IX secretion system membrane protein n=1 Tax=Leptobacterium meishanense TaxID=3128904 RepID=UPI0030EBE284